VDTSERNVWRQQWLSSLNELTDLELQRQSWLDCSNTNQHWSFSEFMCTYFDDLCTGNDYSYPLQKGWITKEEYNMISGWHAQLNAYTAPNDDDSNDQTVLTDPRWIEIAKLGRQMKIQLAQVLPRSESQILLRVIDHNQINKGS
jgi:hypothetical protein